MLGAGRPSEAHTKVRLLPTSVVMLLPMVAVYSTAVSSCNEDSPIVTVGNVGSVEYQQYTPLKTDLTCALLIYLKIISDKYPWAI